MTTTVTTAANGRASHLLSARWGEGRTYCNRYVGKVLGQVGDVVPVKNQPERTYVLDATCRSCQSGYTHDDRKALEASRG